MTQISEKIIKFKNFGLWKKICSDFVFSVFTGSNFIFQISGPLLPIPLAFHSMVRLGKGQAILGGRSGSDYQAKIYSMTCSNRNCIISLLNRELSVPKEEFVAIPIPDTISGCITGGTNDFWKRTLKSFIKLACVKSLFWEAIQSTPKQSEPNCLLFRA